MGEDTRELRREVDEAREQLGDTVSALAYRVNAPKRATDRLTGAFARLKQRASRMKMGAN